MSAAALGALAERRRIIGMLPHDDVLARWLDPAEVGRLDGETLRQLLGMGIDPADIASPLSICRARVIFDGNGRYRPDGVGEPALIIGVLDNGLVDIAAWHPSTGRIGTRLGAGAVLGLSAVDDECGSARRPLPVWRHPGGWLLAHRRGIVIVDWDRAAHLLAGAVLQPEDEAHSAELTRRLRVLPPVIVAPRQIGAAA
jgi:hypothetical protein